MFARLKSSTWRQRLETTVKVSQYSWNGSQGHECCGRRLCDCWLAFCPTGKRLKEIQRLHDSSNTLYHTGYRILLLLLAAISCEFSLPWSSVTGVEQKLAKISPSRFCLQVGQNGENVLGSLCYVHKETLNRKELDGSWQFSQILLHQTPLAAKIGPFILAH